MKFSRSKHHLWPVRNQCETNGKGAKQYVRACTVVGCECDALPHSVAVISQDSICNLHRHRARTASIVSARARSSEHFSCGAPGHRHLCRAPCPAPILFDIPRLVASECGLPPGISFNGRNDVTPSSARRNSSPESVPCGQCNRYRSEDHDSRYGEREHLPISWFILELWPVV